MKKIISLVTLILMMSLVSALPEIHEGIKVVENPTSSNIEGSLYIDGNPLTAAGSLNNVELNYLIPKNSQSAIFHFRIAWMGESPMEYQADVNSACMRDEVQIKQIQATSGSGEKILTTSCFNGIDWIVISTITKPQDKMFDGWYEESVSFWISEKVTEPGVQKSVSSGEVLEVDLGMVEEAESSQYAGIISQVKSGLTEFLEFAGIRIWENVEENKINDFEVLATSVNNPDFLKIERGNLFLESEDVTIKGSTGIFKTYECSDGVNNGFISDSINGTALLFVEASSTPKDYYIFSIYDSTL